MTIAVPPELLPNGAKGLVFDCDGTLMDTMSQHWQSWRLACAKFGLDMTVEQFLSYAGKPGDEIVKILCKEQGKTIDQAAFMKWKRDWYLEQIHLVRPVEPVLAIAQEAQRRGIPMAIASGGGREHVLGAIRANGLEPMFQAFVCAGEYENSKPAPDCFLLAAEKLGVPPELCVGYEDAVLGMEAIRAANFMAAVDVTKLAGYPVLEAQ